MTTEAGPRWRAWAARRAPVRDGVAVCVVGLILRLAVCVWAAGDFPPAEDGAFYYVVAKRISEGQGYTWVWPDGVVTYAAHYPVGYPALLGLVYACVGASPAAAMVLNAVIGAIGVFAVHRLTATVASRLGALVAAVVAAVHPGVLFYTPALMTEGVSAALVAIAAWGSVSDATWMRARWARPLVLGCLFGVMTLVRPQLLLLAPIFSALGARANSRRYALIDALWTTVVALALCAPWTLRNCERLERCVFVSANAGWNLFIGAGERATGSWVPIDEVGFPDECRDVFGEAEKDVCFRRAAMAAIGNDPLRWLSLVPKKLAMTFDYGGAAGWYLHSSNPERFDKQGKLWLGVAETIFQRLTLLAALVAVARVPGPSRRVRVGLSVVLSFAVLVRSGWVAYVGLVVVTLLLGRRLLDHGPASSASATVATTAATHAVFFGAGRYSLVCYLVLAALAGAALTPRGRAGDTFAT